MTTETLVEVSPDLLSMTGALICESNRKLRVCVLHPSAEGTTGPFTEEVDGICKPDEYDPEGHYEWTNVFLLKATCTAELVKLTNSGKYDVYLNLCDGAWDEDRAGKDVVEALERLNVPYTGADAAFYEPSKVDMKKASYFYGIQVPAWVLVQGGPGMQDVGLAEVLAPPERGGLRFPLIVKHPSGYGSIGMTKQSKVTNEEQLREQVSFFVREYGGALVEEFIVGREFTVLVVEEAPSQQLSEEPQLTDLVPVAYTPVECVFGPGEDFKHFDLKFLDYESMGWRPCGDDQLVERLKAAARDTFLAIRGVSYGRCDFRVEEGTSDIYFLEINPNCGVLYPPGLYGSADYILSLDTHYNHRHFISSILASAIHRHRCKQPNVAPTFVSSGTKTSSPLPLPPPSLEGAAVHGMEAKTAVEASPLPSSSRAGGFGRRLATVAIRRIPMGRLVQRGEHGLFTLASRSWVARKWPVGSRERAMVTEAAFPLNEHVLVMPPADLTQWTPLTHSCDPNSRLRGLDLVARRDIDAGEVITVDFATLYGPQLDAPFDCRCGTATCRGRITPQDYLLPCIVESYGDEQVSSFVLAARRHNGVVATNCGGGGGGGGDVQEADFGAHST